MTSCAYGIRYLVTRDNSDNRLCLSVVISGLRLLQHTEVCHEARSAVTHRVAGADTA